MLEVLEIGRMSTVSEGEGRDEMLCSLSFNAFRKVEHLFLEDDKIAFALRSFFMAVSSFFMFVSLFGTWCSARHHTEGEVRILGRQGADACFSFEVDILLNEEVLGKVK